MPNFPWRASGSVPPVGDGELDELLTAGQPPQHAAPALQPVAELLAALQAGPADSELAGKARALAAFRGAAGLQHREHRVRARRPALLRARFAAAAASAVVVAVGGTAAAAYAGALPASLQRVAHVVIAAPAFSARPDPGKHAGHGAGPAVTGHSAYGLCNAYDHAARHGSATEKAVAFRNLAKAASGRSRVKSFCAGVPHPGASPASAASQAASGQGARPEGHVRRPGRHDTWPGKHHTWPGGHVTWPGGHDTWPGIPGAGKPQPHGKSGAQQPGDAVLPAAKRAAHRAENAAHRAANVVRYAVQLTHSTGKPTRVPAPGTRRHPQFRPRL